MKELQVIARWKIHKGQFQKFRELADVCIRSVREKDTNTLQYDWFFDEEKTECVVLERYRDSAALLEHLSNLGETFTGLLAIADFSGEVYGSPSEELLKATEGLDVTVYEFYKSMSTTVLGEETPRHRI